MFWIQGVVLNVDSLKENLAKWSRREQFKKAMSRLDAKFKAYAKTLPKHFGFYALGLYNAKDANHANIMHNFLIANNNGDDSALWDRYREIKLKGIEMNAVKPNLIIDCALSGGKMNDLNYYVKLLQPDKNRIVYDKANRHLVWIVAPLNQAISNVENRDEAVPSNIIQNSHKGAFAQMKTAFNYIDAFKTIVIVFNNREKNDIKLDPRGQQPNQVLAKSTSENKAYNHFFIKDKNRHLELV